jgi:erythromycin esterase
MERVSVPGGRETGSTAGLVELIESVQQPLASAADLDPLLDRIGDARYVLLGEASHGTSEFYTWRARISQRLIQEKGFAFIAVEGDWPDCYHINRYIKGYADAGDTAVAVLQTFQRWPTWMWANWEVAALAEWLRRHNEGLADEQKAGFYGLDVYSLWESMATIMDYLEENQSEAVEAARRAYFCFEPFGQDVQAYARSTMMVPESCEDEVVDLLLELRRKARPYDGDTEAAFDADQNALVLVNAERYYRAMVRSGANSWNIRDNHMMDSLDRLMAYHGPDAKGIVWAHNTHIGDARATDMAAAGMENLGQLAREKRGKDAVVLVGFGSHRGRVIAGRRWGAPMERMRLPPARSRSWESLLHQAGEHDKLLILDDMAEAAAARAWRGHRAIGVVYQPDQEFGNYVPTLLPGRYDAFLFMDESQALHPLHITPDLSQPPETYPWGV